MDIPLKLCKRCGHRWKPRADSNYEPKQCPKCKQYYYDKPAGWEYAEQNQSTPINIVPEKKDEQSQPPKQKKVVRFD